MSEADIDKMKVADLKKELKARGLNAIGNKTELQERLRMAMLEGDSVLEDSVMSEEMLDDDVLNDDELDDDTNALLESHDHVDDILKSPEISESDHLPQSPPDLTTSTTTSSHSKKITLKRNISSSSSSITTQSSTTLNETEHESNAQPPPKKLIKLSQNDTDSNKLNDSMVEIGETGELDENSDKKVVKLSELTFKERLEMRAKKFGSAAIPSDAKKIVRAERFGLTTTKTIDKSKISDNSIKNGTSTTPTAEVLKKRAERFGVSVSKSMIKLENDEKLMKRQQRFGTTGNNETKNDNNTQSSVDYAEKARLRLERFKTTVK